MSIQRKMLLWLSSALILFVIGVNVVMLYLLREIAEKESIQVLSTGRVAHERFNQQRRLLMETKARAIAEIPYLKATLTIPGVDHETLFVTMAGVTNLIDAELSVLTDPVGNPLIVLGPDGTQITPEAVASAKIARRIDKPDYLQIQNNLYAIAAAPIFAGEQIVGHIGIGQRIDSPAALALAEEISDTQALVILDRSLGNNANADLPPVLAAFLTEVPELALQERSPSDVAILPASSSHLGYAAVAIEHEGIGARTVLYKPIDLFESSAIFAWLLMAIGSVLAIILGVAMSQFVAARISRPLLRLTHAAKRFGEGDLSGKIEVYSSDEVGKLAKAFNDMAANLASSQRRLIDSRDAAEAASRAKSEFLARMSHEIRTPMNGVLGMTDLLARSALDESQARCNEIIQQSGRSLLAIVNDMLDFSKVESGSIKIDLQPIDVGQIVNDSIALLTEMAEAKGVGLTSTLAGVDSGLVYGDGGRLQQVLVNLVNNAIKFTEHGEVRVTVEKTGVPDELRFSVADTGIGIEAEKQRQIFDLFYQVDGSSTRTYDGTGLGLAICQQLVKLMKGQIGVRSAPNQGSEFWFTLVLKRACNDTAVIQTLGAGASTPENLGYRVLLVEDNPVNQMVATKMLVELGCDTVLAENGAVAVERFSQARWDLVLMDCQMPEMDGFEATAKIRSYEQQQQRQRTPIVALTAYALKGDAERCLSAGMTDYLSKPVSLAGLSEVMVRSVNGSATPAQVLEMLADKHDDLCAPTTLNLDLLSELREFQMPGEPDVVEEVVETFIASAQSCLADLESAEARHDADAIRAAAHRLKGASGSVGAERLAHLCGQLEAAARSGQITAASSAVCGLEVEFTALVVALREQLDLPIEINERRRSAV